MKMLIIFFLLLLPSKASSEIVIELSKKKLPVFNTYFLKGDDKNYLIEKDPINNISYIANISCFVFEITGLTENEKLLLNDNDIANLVETAHDYADIFCPNTDKMVFTIANSLNITENSTLFRTVLDKNDGWQENKEKRNNRVKEKIEKKRLEIKKKLEGMQKKEQLAYLLGKEELQNLAKAAFKSLIEGSPVEVTGMVLVSDIDNEGVFYSKWPIDATISGIKDEKAGYYLFSGTLIGRDFLKAEIHVEKYIACQKKGCQEFIDPENVMKVIRNEKN